MKFIMPKKVVIVLKGGSLKEQNINVKESDLYKKCNFKNFPETFEYTPGKISPSFFNIL